MQGGTALAAAFARELVEPLLVEAFPATPLSLARLGSGSDVLGLDDAISQDHDWGLRLTVVVPAAQVAAVSALLEERLPDRFRERPVRFATSWDPAVRQRAEVLSARSLSMDRTGADATRPLGLLDHLSMTGQAVLEAGAGPVFRDDDDVLARLRTALQPTEDVRRWAVASAWQRIAEELPFVGRAGERGDETGSAVIAARIARIVMHLGFHLQRRPAPYAKWLGTAFAGLPVADTVGPGLGRAVSGGWRAAEDGLVAALEAVAAVQGAAGLPAPSPVTERFYDRPYRGLRPVAQEVRATIVDPEVRELPLIGLPDLWTDDVRILTDHPVRRRATAALLGLDADAAVSGRPARA